MNPQRRPKPAPVRAAAAERELPFCAVCQVSISSAEIASGEARRTPKGRLFCGECVRSTPEERVRRREELEAEFADDAPIPVPAPIPSRRAPEAAPATPADVDVVFLERRVGELERAAFRMQSRIAELEERLDARTGKTT
jgi:hypothetical protein